MIRFLFRLLATIVLAAAVILAVIDATRTVAASALVLTPLGDSWGAALPGMPDAARSLVVEKIGAPFWDVLVTPVLRQPGFAVFLVLAFLFYAIGRRPEQRMGRVAARG